MTGYWAAAQHHRQAQNDVSKITCREIWQSACQFRQGQSAPVVLVHVLVHVVVHVLKHVANGVLRPKQPDLSKRSEQGHIRNYASQQAAIVLRSLEASTSSSLTETALAHKV